MNKKIFNNLVKNYKKKVIKKRDFFFVKKIGKGAFSSVHLVKELKTQKLFAIKVISTFTIDKKNKLKLIETEKKAFEIINNEHPGIVNFFYSFKEKEQHFFVFEYLNYGDLFSLIDRIGIFPEILLKFYICQIIDVIEFIHLKNIVHRDLKIENILVDENLNLKISDFGTAKIILNDSVKLIIEHKNYFNEYQESIIESESFVGTPEYLTPEFLTQNISGFETDIWAVGHILYFFFHGNSPFKDKTEYLTFKKILKGHYIYSDQNSIPKEVKNLIDDILVVDRKKRANLNQIKNLNWFKNINWNKKSSFWRIKNSNIDLHIIKKNISDKLKELDLNNNEINFLNFNEYVII